jgi:hypothetical protein
MTAVAPRATVCWLPLFGKAGRTKLLRLAHSCPVSVDPRLMSPIQYDLDFGDFSEHLLAVVSYSTRLLEKILPIQMLIDFAEHNRLTIPRNASINRIEPKTDVSAQTKLENAPRNRLQRQGLRSSPSRYRP